MGLTEAKSGGSVNDWIGCGSSAAASRDRLRGKKTLRFQAEAMRRIQDGDRVRKEVRRWIRTGHNKGEVKAAGMRGICDQSNSKQVAGGWQSGSPEDFHHQHRYNEEREPVVRDIKRTMD